MEFGSVVEFAFPGPLRDSLVAAVLSGAKTSTTGLLADYRASDDPLPAVGQRQGVVDSDGVVVGVIEIMSVDVVALHEVTLRHAIAEGEGHTSVEQWRRDHELFWHSDGMRSALGDPGFVVDDDTLVVCEEFQLVP